VQVVDCSKLQDQQLKNFCHQITWTLGGGMWRALILYRRRRFINHLLTSYLLTYLQVLTRHVMGLTSHLTLYRLFWRQSPQPISWVETISPANQLSGDNLPGQSAEWRQSPRPISWVETISPANQLSGDNLPGQSAEWRQSPQPISCVVNKPVFLTHHWLLLAQLI